MTPAPTRPLTDDELHALADGEGSPSERSDLNARLDADPGSQARLAAWLHQRKLLLDLHDQVLQESVPPALLQAAQRANAMHGSAKPWWRYGGVAAGVVLAFGAGWLSNAQWANTALSRVGTGGAVAA